MEIIRTTTGYHLDLKEGTGAKTGDGIMLRPEAQELILYTARMAVRDLHTRTTWQDARYTPSASESKLKEDLPATRDGLHRDLTSLERMLATRAGSLELGPRELELLHAALGWCAVVYAQRAKTAPSAAGQAVAHMQYGRVSMLDAVLPHLQTEQVITPGERLFLEEITAEPFPEHNLPRPESPK